MAAKQDDKLLSDALWLTHMFSDVFHVSFYEAWYFECISIGMSISISNSEIVCQKNNYK